MSDINELKIYDSLSLPKTWEIPKRSRLYPLRPIGIGTPYVESLTSYINRLSEAHCVFPRALITKIIVPELQRTFARKLTSRGLNSLFLRSHAINGYGEMAQDFVNVVESLTCSQNLRFITLLTWSEVLVWQGLLRKHKAWCPQCYREAFASGHQLYEQLIWSLKAVKVCPKHHLLLSETCPHCKQSMPLINWQSRAGFCSECGELLVDTNNTQSCNHNDTEKEDWIAKSLGNLIARTPTILESPSKTILRDNLVAAVDTLTEGNMAAFASWIKTPKNTFWGWYQGKSFPTLEALLNISWVLNISVLELLTHKIEFTSLGEINRCTPSNQKNAKRLSPKNFDSKTVQKALVEVLNQSNSEIPTIKEIAKKLGYERRLITKHFPKLCHAIVTKRRNLEKANHEIILQDCCEEVQKAVTTLYNQGEYPTEARVSQMISRPGFLRYKRVRDRLITAREQL